MTDQTLCLAVKTEGWLDDFRNMPEAEIVSASFVDLRDVLRRNADCPSSPDRFRERLKARPRRCGH